MKTNMGLCKLAGFWDIQERIGEKGSVQKYKQEGACIGVKCNMLTMNQLQTETMPPPMKNQRQRHLHIPQSIDYQTFVLSSDASTSPESLPHNSSAELTPPSMSL